MSWTHHWDYAGIYSRIDFIFVSQGLYREIDREKSFVYHYMTQEDPEAWVKASDHRPLVAGIRAVDVELQP